jgi:hypothetical protein
MNFTKSRTYKWHEILDGLEAVNAPPYYLLRHRVTQKVVAACLVIGVNPRAPYEIIPAKGPLIRRWADAFCKQRGTLDVFVQEAGGQWYYRGQFRLAGESSDANELKLRALQANRRNLYKILFLEEVR